MKDLEVLASSAVVDAIKKSTKIEIIDLDGNRYFSKNTFLPPEEPATRPLKAHTLNAITTYIHADANFGIEESMLVHIRTPSQVELVSPLTGRHNQRHTYLSLDCEELNKSTFRFGRFMEPEEFVIGLMSQFEDAGDRTKVLKIVGNLRSENVTDTSDDGVAQTVVTRKGIASVANTDVPSIVELAPYRTFREVLQPTSKFLLRFQQGSGNRAEVGLFEADGGGWKLAAIEQIYEHLSTALDGMSIPIIY